MHTPFFRLRFFSQIENYFSLKLVEFNNLTLAKRRKLEISQKNDDKLL